MNWLKTHAKLIGGLFIGLVLALLGAQKLAAKRGQRAAELRADIAVDKHVVAEARAKAVDELAKADIKIRQAKEIENAVEGERSRLAAKLMMEKPDIEMDEVMRIVNKD